MTIAVFAPRAGIRVCTAHAAGPLAIWQFCSLFLIRDASRFNGAGKFT